MNRSFRTIIALTFLAIHFAMAGTTGKIAGIVTDSETGEPLTGVNIFLEGSGLGAATDLDGYYVILNVNPGVYILKTSYVGYAEHEIKGVEVRIDLTTEVNILLKSQILEGEVVVVEAERPVVTRDISNSQLNIEAESIKNLPVQKADQVLTLQAGIEMSNQGIVVRGGGVNQTVFMVDGQSLNDERSNIPYLAMSISSIEEVQIQTGGFNAEYGNVRSGLVNVVTREGSRSEYNASIILNYSPAAQKHLGPSLYDPYSYFNRPYMDPDVCWTGTDNGAWDENMRKQYPNFEGWNTISEKTLQDNNPDNDLTPEGAKQLFEWQRRRAGDIDKADYFIDAGFGGPVPFVGKWLGDMRFYLTHFNERNMFVFPLSKEAYTENHTQLKLTSNIGPSMKLTTTALYGEVGSVSPYNWKTTPTGRVLKGVSEVADLASSPEAIYIPGYYSPTDIYRTVASLKFTHAVSPTLFYEAKLQQKISRYNTYQSQLRDTSKVYEPVPGYFVDEAPYGYWGYSSSGIEGMSLGGWMNLGRDKTVNSTTSFSVDVTNQYNPKNQIKAGLSIVYNDYDVKSTTESPSMSTWTRSMIYRIYPYRIGAYIQDKLEFEGFIANLGLRWDFSDANSDYFDLDTYDKYYKAGYGSKLEQEVPVKDTKPDSYISPRLGISHPITENSKLYFNYGHFLSEASSTYRFRIQRESNGLVTNMGNRNLKMEKTIAYEVGFEQNLLDMFLLKIAAYYKDITNQPGWIYYRNINGTVQYYKTENNNYADIRGFEVTLTKRLGRWISGFVNYTYDVSTSGYFGLREYYEDPNMQREYLRLNPYQSRPRPQPYARANLNFNVPPDVGPDWLGIRPLTGWNLNVLAYWRAGAYYTFNPNQVPGLVDNVRFRDYHNVDLRLSKEFTFGRYGVQFFVDVSNLFNVKNFSFAGFSDRYDRENYLQSLRFSWEEGEQKGSDKIGDYRPVGVAFDPLEANPDNDPEIAARNKERIRKKSYIDMPNIRSLTFLNPRDIFFGIKIEF